MQFNHTKHFLKFFAYRSSPPEPAAAAVLHIESPLHHKVSLGATLLGQSTHLVGLVESSMLLLSLLETSGGASGSSWSPHPMKLSPSAVLLPGEKCNFLSGTLQCTVATPTYHQDSIHRRWQHSHIPCHQCLGLGFFGHHSSQIRCPELWLIKKWGKVTLHVHPS